VFQKAFVTETKHKALLNIVKQYPIKIGQKTFYSPKIFDGSLIITTLVRSQGSVISIVNRLQIRLTEGVRDLSLVQGIETAYGALPACHSKGIRGSLPGIKTAGPCSYPLILI
jgi:hypothetical protein